MCTFVLCIMQTLYLVHIFLTNTSWMQSDLATNLQHENWEDSRCLVLQEEIELRLELCGPHTEQTISPWGCRGRCFPGCRRSDGSRGCWTWHLETGMDILQGTPGVICTSIPRKLSPWDLPPSRSMREDCHHQERRRYPYHQTSSESSAHSVISLKLAGLLHQKIC